MGKTVKKPMTRDFNIVKTAKGELDLSTKSIKSKKAYTRKQKYKEF